jgi:hypothetical protein
LSRDTLPIFLKACEEHLQLLLLTDHFLLLV